MTLMVRILMADILIGKFKIFGVQYHNLVVKLSVNKNL